MTALLAVLLATAQADDPSPFTSPPKYTAKIDLILGTLWVKGEKYKIQFTRGPKGGILDDGVTYVSWNDFRKTVTQEPSGLAALRKKWAEAGQGEREKVKGKLGNYAFNPIMRDWVELDGSKWKRSDGGKVAGKDTELIEAQGFKMWRMKGTHVILKAQIPGIVYEAKSVEEGVEVPDDVFKAPDGLAEKKSESDISDVKSAEVFWEKLVR
jgi:hypothetical protein